ncbi:MAG TPA: hypothetical protein V6D17_08670 [Candidatus Obscuribacterales bacterium]
MLKKLALVAAVAAWALSLNAAEAQNRFGATFAPAPSRAQAPAYPVLPGQVAPGAVNPYYYPYRYPYTYANPGLVPYGAGYPVIGMPQPIGGGYFGINIGGARLNFWQAPSGYYYPWLPRPYGLTYSAPIIIYQQGQSTPAQPPLSTVFSDMIKFLDESKEKNKVAEADYNHLRLRATDLQRKEASLSLSGGGTLDEQNEAQLRKDADQLGKEISYRVKQ